MDLTAHETLPFSPSALFDCVENCQTIAVRALIAAGADVNQVRGGDDEDVDPMERPLHVAARSANPESARIIRFILNAEGVDCNARDYTDMVPLHHAAGNTVSAILEELLRDPSRVDVEAVDCDLRTPIFEACSENILKNVKLLLQAGANPSAVDRRGHMPLYITKCKKIRNLLIEAGADQSAYYRLKAKIHADRAQAFALRQKSAEEISSAIRDIRVRAEELELKLSHIERAPISSNDRAIIKRITTSLGCKRPRSDDE